MEFLFDKAKKDFDVPPLFVIVADFFCQKLKVIGDKPVLVSVCSLDLTSMRRKDCSTSPYRLFVFKTATRKLPAVTPQPQSVPLPELPATPVSPEPPPVPADNYPLKTTFFGTSIALKDIPKLTLRLFGTSEKEFADYWTELSKLSVDLLIDEVLRLKSKLRLNDWGVYQLSIKLFTVYFPQGSENEQVIFSVFLLNQLGYRAKIGRSGYELVPLIAFQQMV